MRDATFLGHHDVSEESNQAHTLLPMKHHHEAIAKVRARWQPRRVQLLCRRMRRGPSVHSNAALCCKQQRCLRVGFGI